MTLKLKKSGIPTILTWILLLCSFSAVGVHFVSCSREVSRIVENQHDELDSQLIDLQANMPPISDQLPTKPTILQRKNKDSILTYNRPVVLPCSVDSSRASKNSGGVIYLHCGGEEIGSLTVKPNSITNDTTIQISSYSLAVFGLDVREYHFSPDGLQFSKKAELKLSADLFKKSDGSPADEILWLYLNPHTQRWELQSVVQRFPDGYFHIELSHFSTYRAATRSGVGVSQGGQVKPNVK